MKTVRLLIADDHVMVRVGLASLLLREPVFEVVAEACDGEEALAAVDALRPDVAIVDIRMPRMSGIEVTSKIRERGHSTAVVLLSMNRGPAFVRAGLRAGACGFVLKEDEAGYIVQAVSAAARGEVYLSPSAAEGVEPSRDQGRSEAAPKLSARESEVLRLLVDGLSTKEIATALCIGIRTVDSHRAAIMEKLDLHNIPGLVKYAIRHHLVQIDETA